MHQAASDQRQEDIQLRTALETQLSQHREQVIFIFTEFFSHHQKEFQFHEKNKILHLPVLCIFHEIFHFLASKTSGSIKRSNHRKTSLDGRTQR